MHCEMVSTQFEFLQRYHSISVQVYFMKLFDGRANEFQIFNFMNLKVFTHQPEIEKLFEIDASVGV